jgi:hypothetical protein
LIVLSSPDYAWQLDAAALNMAKAHNLSKLACVCCCCCCCCCQVTTLLSGVDPSAAAAAQQQVQQLQQEVATQGAAVMEVRLLLGSCCYLLLHAKCAVLFDVGQGGLSSCRPVQQEVEQLKRLRGCLPDCTRHMLAAFAGLINVAFCVSSQDACY